MTVNIDEDHLSVLSEDRKVRHPQSPVIGTLNLEYLLWQSGHGPAAAPCSHRHYDKLVDNIPSATNYWFCKRNPKVQVLPAVCVISVNDGCQFLLPCLLLSRSDHSARNERALILQLVQLLRKAPRQRQTARVEKPQ